MGPGDSIENDVDGVFARDAHLLARLEVLDRKRAGGNLVFSEEDDIGNRKLVGVLNLRLELLCLGVELGADALGPQGVFLMLARDSFLHGLLPFGESVIWTRNILYMVCAGLSCAAASLARRNRNRGGTPMFALVFIISRMPVTLGEGDASCLWLAVVLIVTAIGFGLALTAAHNGKRKEDDDETETDAG